ncbi:MAG TPA: hypothetical protein VG028_03120 [Terriglobia bacterium]|nr:hypothetical protein [Terriglobia bacterium]
MSSGELLQSDFSRAQQRALVVGGVGLTACAAGAFANGQEFFRSYLVAYMLWLGIALGCTSLLMLHHLVGGGWGYVIRRLLESGARTFPVLLILGVPFLIGVSPSHAWVRAEAFNPAALSEFKRVYMGTTFFYGRAAFYFGSWLFLGYLLNKWSFEQDVTREPGRVGIRLQALSGPGLIIYGMTITYASIDWVMSLEPGWSSTIFGMMFMVAQALSAMAFVIIVLMRLTDRKPLSDVVQPSHFHDLGTLLFAFVMLWAYLSFSQFLIIWSGNLRDEIPWYLSRSRGEWAWLAVFLIVFHFAIPFFLLLSRDLKRKKLLLSMVAAALIFMTWVDLYWIVMPSFDHAGPQLQWLWLNLAAPIGIGGIWVSAFIWQLKGRPLLPLNDPEFAGGARHVD